MRASLAALISVLSALPAAAQEAKPSFDCAKATLKNEKLICSKPKLAKADAELAAAYSAFLAQLDAKAKTHLMQDQARWVRNRDQECADDNADVVVQCLKKSYGWRAEFLKIFGDGAYPFISTHAVFGSGKIKNIAFSATAEYPQFDGATADFQVLNKHFADEAAEAVNRNTPTAGDAFDRAQEWSYEQSFTVDRPTPRAISIVTHWFGFTGGAHPNGAVFATLVDLQTGKAAGLDDIFVDGWLAKIAEIARADLQEQFKQKPGFDDALAPAKFNKLLADPAHYQFMKDELDLSFNRYEVGSYASGPFDVEIPYARIKTLLRADGPLGALR